MYTTYLWLQNYQQTHLYVYYISMPTYTEYIHTVYKTINKHIYIYTTYLCLHIHSICLLYIQL